ncbi:hypothetical protein DNL40_01120 [Xylanimonas oleitrophica]|uniref:Transcription factor zinc-finger domain-containing protein n=1 Tax=Xylanimonas oleitrophica TaxID=2607479 RepID=A0A2W5XWQ2_9MICO|nr:zf-TFIIB domain-containing protein [Xylanimonas oleitrophica]PZR55028.1 hypothetical protein DNL40_01120 [Xylanimonas oleitrophica]
MQCPTDGTTLVMSERKGVEIDYCPTCRGVWLDRGELDKIIDRSMEAEIAAEPASRPEPPASAPPPDYRAVPPGGYEQQRYDQPRYGGERYDDRRRDPRYDGRDAYGRKKKRDSWLEDLFDF